MQISRAGVRVRSPESLAARVEREHERAAAAVLSQGDGPPPPNASVTRRDRATAEHAAVPDAQLANTGGGVRGHCCVDRLRPPTDFVALRVLLKSG